ncbi:peroxiredoxin family protein [Urbifossiella limnaea]|uniref:thioredoxin-dependent peroxiredoxin n=1 Tax=Urbifossiella limnaea TaxID=2528023 RepID=A0A517XPH2_9BACT|nr:peroxiredoxin family protein [Urbifossiella limnaea]QDU19411.1 AhpC/TSA family protein [Urbifossiella limnaea]
MRRRFGAMLMGVLLGAGGVLAADPGPQVGQQAKEFDLEELGGGRAKLSDLTKGGPVVLVVLRGYPGYQCPICSRQFGEFLGKADDFKKAGATVAFVYPGPGAGLKQKAGEFVKGRDYPAHFRVLLDPDYTFTNAYGLRWDAKNETAYPSTFALGTDRKVTFARVSTTHGGRLSAADALKALAAK